MVNIVRSRLVMPLCGLLLALHAGSSAFAATATWTGLDANDSLWSSPTNWTGLGVNPDIVFPNGTARKSNENDFPGNANVASLTFTGGNYFITGASIFLAGGINASIPSSPAGGFTFGPAITLAANQSFTSTGAVGYTLNGAIALGGRQLTLAGSGDATLNGNITGTGTLVKSGSGTATFNGFGGGFGVTTLNTGNLRVVGTLGNVTFNGGTLSGQGTVGSVSVATGTAKSIAPGSGGTTTATISAGAVTLSSSTTLAIDLNGTTAGSQYDKLATTSINLANATLALSTGFVPPTGTTFTIISGAVTGTFLQGSSISVGGRSFAIQYNPSSVVLTAMPFTRTWNGNGNDALWMTPGNWVGGVAPTAGDSLVFPAGAARPTNTNNFPAGTQFGSLTFTGAPYSLNGASVALASGIVVNVPGGSGIVRFSFPITLAAAQSFSSNSGPDVQFLGALFLNSFALTLDTSGFISVGATIDGAGGIVKLGSGVASFSQFDSYSGVTAVNAGTLILPADGAAGATGAGNGTTVASGATLTVQSDSSHSEPLVLNGAGTNGAGALITNACTGSGCAMTGPVTLASNSTIGVIVSDDLLQLGPVGETGGPRTLTVSGAGTLNMTGTSTHTGATIVSAGTRVQLNGATGAVALANGTLGGAGSVGSIGGPGTITPGVIGSSASPGTLNVSGNVTLTNANTLIANIGGLTPGTQHDRLTVTGAVTLTGSTLLANLFGGFIPATGSSIVLIEAAGGVTGQFAQGTSMTINGIVFAISYGATSVTLTPLPTTRTWSGAGADFNWSTPANWVGGVQPGPGDSLVFPAGAAKLGNTNNFPAGTAFGSIAINDTYFIGGNRIDLAGGLVFDAPTTVGTNPQFMPPIRLTAAQAFAASGGRPLLLGAVDLGGFVLTVNGSKALVITGAVTGAGSIVKSGTGNLGLRNASSTYTGTTEVLAGVLSLDASGAAGSAAAGNGTNVANGAFLRLASDSTHAEPLTLNGGSAASLATISCPVGCAATGPITLAADSAVAASQPDHRLTLGPVGETGGARRLAIEGFGKVTLTGTSTHTGRTEVSGTLVANGVMGDVELLSSGTLNGIGTVGDVSGTGTIAPGASTGILTATGVVFIGQATKVAIEIGGTTPGTQHDQLNGTGFVRLGNAVLQGSLINGFIPAAGDQFTIIQSADQIIGRFAQDSSIAINGIFFEITYNAKSVVLTTAAGPPQPDLTITKTHSGDFQRGQTGLYTATVTNSGAGALMAGGVVSVVDTPSAGLTVTAMSGSGWTCITLPTCTRSDALAGFSSYPPITITVSVSADAVAFETNSVAVSTSAVEANTANNSVTDSTTILTGITIVKSGSGTGSVASSNNQISCGATCSSGFDPGNGVTLGATPAAGSKFTGWLGPCTGTGANAIGGGATRLDPGAILAYLNDIRPLLDVDGNGVVDPFTDGLLVMRGLFGLQGDPLIQGAIGKSATRTIESAIRTYLSTLRP